CFSFVFLKLSTPFNDGFKPARHSRSIGRAAASTKQGSSQEPDRGRKQGIEMARFEMFEAGFGAMGATAQADILFELGMMYATGRDCESDVVAAHKWFNIAAI